MATMTTITITRRDLRAAIIVAERVAINTAAKAISTNWIRHIVQAQHRIITSKKKLFSTLVFIQDYGLTLAFFFY